MTTTGLVHYEISALLGKGGMGEVYRATDTKLGREVALKMLPEAVATDPERLAGFRREAQVLASLNHPGIAAVYGLESSGDRHALVMELVPGPELAELLTEGPLSVKDALAIALQIAEAVEAAHEKGVIHRDLKPANIKFGEDGRVKVLDFGLARALGTDPAGRKRDQTDSSLTLTANLTLDRVVTGTAAYMSPEQARGAEVDKRTDIWAFGVVMDEMLCGRNRFSGDTVSDTLAAVLKSTIDLDDLPDDLPQAVRRLIGRCLQRDPKYRLRDIGDARIVLQEALTGDTTEPVQLPQPRRSWPLRAAITVALAAIAAAAIGFLQPHSAAELPLRKFEIPLGPDDASAGVAFAPQISPDGRHLLYLSHGQIWVRDMATAVARPLPATEGARYPFWSPDSEWIGYSTAHELMKIDVSGGRCMILANLAGNLAMGHASSATWNPDGSIYYTTGATGLLRSSAAAGEVTLHHATREGEMDFHEVCRLPDNRGWVLVVHTESDYGNLILLSASGERKKLFCAEGDAFSNPVWSPTGHLLFVREHVAAGIWAVPLSLETTTVTGDPFLVAAGGQYPSVAADGTLVYTAGIQPADLQLAWFDRHGEPLEIIADLRTKRPFPALSPDGTRILLAANTDGKRQLWMYDAGGGNEQRLTFDDREWGAATWHPDGQRIVAYTTPDYLSYLITLDGSAPPRELGPGIFSQIGRDGTSFFYSRPELAAGFDFDVYARPLDAAVDKGRAVASTPAIEWAPAPSPDGAYLLYVSDESGTQEVYATTYPEMAGRWQVSRGGGGWAAWRGDGKEVYYADQEAIYSVAITDKNGFTPERPRRLFTRASTEWSTSWPDGFAVSPDGQRFLMLRPAPDAAPATPYLVVVQNWFAEFAQR
jgi:serine/threonine protein kinase/Tol biopolymer transport system component